MPELAYKGDEPREVVFIASSRADLKAFPDEARSACGAALQKVQFGRMPVDAKPLRGFGGAGIQEIVADDAAGTFRLVYVVSLPDAVYVLHAFQKKSTSGIKTSQRDIDLIRRRLREAQRLSQLRLSR